MEKMLPACPELPDSFVFAVPVISQPVHDLHDSLPTVFRNPGRIFIGQVNSIHNLAVDIELKLLGGAIPNAYWPRLPISGKMVELDLVQMIASVGAVYHAERTVLPFLFETVC